MTQLPSDNKASLRILPRERAAILNSLAAGVVPRLGLHLIQVGRRDEVASLLEDLQRIEEGGAAIRFVAGRFGSGKSFFLNLIQAVALEHKLVVVRADITTQRRLHSSGGHAQSLYAELMHNMSTRSKPEGGALANLVERWVSDVAYEVTKSGGSETDVPARLAELCKPLRDLVCGYDFVHVLMRYYQGFLEGNEAVQAAALRWLRAEYHTKTEARQDLGVRTIIDDAGFYDHLKLFGRFVRIAGYSGLLVCLDELVVLSHRLNNKTARNNNYEAILRILNDCLQGSVSGLGFIFAATEDCMYDPRRGLFSYEAMASRLAPNRFAGDGMVDLTGPIISLKNLTPEDCYVLLHNIRRVYSGGNQHPMTLPDEGIEAYLRSCHQRMGAAYFQTPRETIKDFIGLLNVLAQNPQAEWRNLIGEIKTSQVQSHDPSEINVADDQTDDLASFKL